MSAPGPIAQLEERLNGIEEVVGSNPIGSTDDTRARLTRVASPSASALRNPHAIDLRCPSAAARRTSAWG